MKRFIAALGLAGIIASSSGCGYFPEYLDGKVTKETGSVTTSTELLPREERDYYLEVETVDGTYKIDVRDVLYRPLHDLANEIAVGDSVRFKTNFYESGPRKHFNDKLEGYIFSDEIEPLKKQEK